MEAFQQDQTHNPSHPIPPNNPITIQDPDLFAFLKANDEPRPTKSSPSFFSENGLGQDIIQVTQAEPDVCLEVFYALYNILWPQIEKQSDFSLKDAWTRFIGGSVFKGTLCPPEKLITERRIRDIKRSLSEPEGEARIFHDLDQVVNSILNLKQKIDNHPGEILFKKETIVSLTLVQEFYQSYRNQVKGLVQAILEKEQINASCVLETDALEDLLESKAIMMSDVFPHHWAYRISRNQAQKLLSLDPNGRILKNNLNDPSNHRVIALPEKTVEPLVFFKANGNPPIQPEKEFMIYSLYKHLQIPVPETAIVILTNVFLENPEYLYAVQASEAVLGESSLKVSQDPEITFDHEAYVSQTIGAFLTNPSDGSFKNFKYSPIYHTLISIDNDLVFKPELNGKDEKKIVNVKSILYLLPQIDNPIPESVQTFFTTLDPHLLTFAWLQDLSRKNREYQLLFTRLAFQKTRCIYQNLLPQSEVPPLSKCLQQKIQVDRELHGDSFDPKILVSQNLLVSVIEKLKLIEKIFLQNRSVSTQRLFEEISPILGKYYRKLRFEFNDPEEALEALWGNKKNDIDYSYISSLLDHEELINLSSSQNELDEKNITPEMFLKEYKDILLSSAPSPLDGYIRRQNQRKKKNSLNLQVALNELRFIIQEDLINSHYIREIVDFCHSLSKVIDSNPLVLKEVISLLSNLPHPELKWLLTLEKHFLRPDRHVPKDLLISSVEVLGALMKKRTLILTKSENKYLFDQQGNILKKSSLTGRSNVTCFPEENPEFYLKQYPEWPGYEFASTLFMRLLGVTHLPYQDLVIINSKYPALLTQKVHGNPVLRIWHNSQALHNLDPFHTTLLIISAMLINPEDGKEDNFILSPDGRFLIPIDNDHCFLPSTFQKEGKFWNAFTVNTALQTKTILFCLDEMYMPLPNEVRKHILSLDFDLLLTKWMNELDKIENKINNLVDQKQRNKFLQQGTVMRIPFYKQFIQSLHWKAHTIQNLLNAASEITPFDLLKTVEPFAARCYQDSFKQGNSLQSRFKAATNNLYAKTALDGSRVSILNTRAMMKIINISVEDLQNDVIFQKMGPVDALELLNLLIQERNQKAIMEQEMLCELDEKKQESLLKSLFGNPQGEAALKDFFASSQENLVLKGSKLITASKLTELFAQAPNKGMRIRFLSLPESPLLTDKEIRILTKECPNLEYLNVSGCMKLKQFITTRKEWSLLTRLEARNCLKLSRFISHSPIKILQIETDQGIEIFLEKPTLDFFTISKKIREFEFSLKKGENPEIKSQGEELSNKNFLLDVISGKEAIQKYFRIWSIIMKIPEKVFESSVTFLDFESSYIDVQDVQRIVLLNLINLKGLILPRDENSQDDTSLPIQPIGDEGMEILSRGNWPFLEILNLRSANMTSRGVNALVNQAQWSRLKQLDLSKNQIHDGDIEALATVDWPLLESLGLAENNVTSGGVEIIVNQAKWTKLKLLDLSGNKIHDEGLEILSKANWPLLETLGLDNSGISKMKLFHFILNAKWPNLQEVYCPAIGKDAGKNLLRKNWHLLENLNLRGSEITLDEIEFIVNNCNWPRLESLALKETNINDQGLEILSQANWPLLKYLDLLRTQISKQKFFHFLLTSKWSNLKSVFFANAARSLIPKDQPLLKYLDLSKHEITQHEIELIVNNCNWPQLLYLDLSGNEINDEGLEILSNANWPLLENLYFPDARISKKGFLHFILNPKWSNLEEVNWDPVGSTGNVFTKNLLQKNWHLLQCLDLGSSDLTQNDIEAIINQSNWPQLKQLILSDNKICDEGIKLLSQGNWPLLEVLNLSETNISSRGVEVLVNQANWTKLKLLDLLGNKIYDEGLEILSQANWPLLESLSLDRTEITSQGIQIFVEKMNLPNLKKLDLSNNKFEGFAFEKCPPVEKLNLSNTGISKKDLIQKLDLSHLKELDISHNPIQNEGLEVLASWNQLEYLNLEKTEITDKGIEILISKSCWPNLKGLDISDNEIGDEGLKALSSGKWPLLESLSLRKLKMTGEGIESITSKSEWPSLKVLDLSESDQMFMGEVDVLRTGKWPLLEYLYVKNTTDSPYCFSGLLADCPWPYLKEIHFQGFDSQLAKYIIMYESMISKKCPNVKLILS